MKTGWFIKWVGFSLAAGILLLSVTSFPVSARTVQQGYDCAAQSAMPEEQCLALVALYESAGGSGWENNAGWLTSPDPCGWYGVSCSEGEVVALDMFGNNLVGTLPLEIGSLTGLRTLTLNDNSLTGEIPVTITYLDLDLIHFHNTGLCEPADPAFQDWIFQIVYRLSTGQYCSPLTPSATPNAAQTQTAAAQPTSVLFAPQQTLTALALVAPPSATPQPTATRVSTQLPPTATQAAAAGEDDGSGTASGQPNDGGTQTGGQGGLFSRISPVWWLLVLIPILLIVTGIVLELRERRTARPDEKADEDADYYTFASSDSDRLK